MTLKQYFEKIREMNEDFRIYSYLFHFIVPFLIFLSGLVIGGILLENIVGVAMLVLVGFVVAAIILGVASYTMPYPEKRSTKHGDEPQYHSKTI